MAGRNFIPAAETFGQLAQELARLEAAGVPVPPSVTIPLPWSLKTHDLNPREDSPRWLKPLLDEAIRKLERASKRKFGDHKNPLLLSVRSSAAVHLSGLQPAVLNIGHNLNESSDRPDGDWLWDCRYRWMLSHALRLHAVDLATMIAQPVQPGRVLCEKADELFQAETGEHFPRVPRRQLEQAVLHAMQRWHEPLTQKSWRERGHGQQPGVAVTIQVMALGNRDERSGVARLDTRLKPSTGTKPTWAIHAMRQTQGPGGETVDSPEWFVDERAMNLMGDQAAIQRLIHRTEKVCGQALTMEIVRESGQYWVVRCKARELTDHDAIFVAVTLANDKIISRKQAIARIEPARVDQLLTPGLSVKAARAAELLATGYPGARGVGMGSISFNAHDAITRARNGEKIILVRRETAAEDVAAIAWTQGVLTSTGGMTSHAAVVARGAGKCAVVGASDLIIDEAAGRLTIGEREIDLSQPITLDGSTGRVFLGALPTEQPRIGDEVWTLLNWADQFAHLKVHANADTPEDAALARSYGSQGIGLCRIEHLFFHGPGLRALRAALVAPTSSQRAEAVKRWASQLQKHFAQLLKAMRDQPVVIRLLDPPMHEFLPTDARAISELAHELKMTTAQMQQRIADLAEFNPMLGNRGVRLCVCRPDLLEAQITAVQRAVQSLRSVDKPAVVRVLLPMVGFVEEITLLRKRMELALLKVRKDERSLGQFGAMIELPRACLVADRIAEQVHFLSIGTNDLTQMALAISRDDAGLFTREYEAQGVFHGDPFQTLDVQGVGQLVAMAIERARAAKPGIPISVCGEHGGDPASIQFFHDVGVDVISVSPYRVPAARLAAGQAALRSRASTLPGRSSGK